MVSTTIELITNNNTIIEIIKIAIWPFLLFVFALIFIVLFKKQISEFISKIKELNLKKDGLEAKTCPDETKEEVKEEVKEEQMQKIELEDETKGKEIEEPKTIDEWRTEMIFSSIEKKKDRAERAYKELMKLNQDNLSRKKDDVLKLKLFHTFGETNSIDELKKYSNDNDIKFDALMAIGFCYSFSNEVANSNKFYLDAMSNANNDEDRVSAVSQYSSNLYKDKKKTEALEILSETLQKVTDPSCKIELYENMAKIYEKEKDYENRAFVFDKAVELKPNDQNLIFDAGYSYAESKYDELSLLHYKNAEKINPKNGAVKNNLGVQYDNLNMPIKSIESYREADKLNITLASANIAYRFMKAGFVAEAKNILDIAKNKDDVHPNVNEALSEISKKIENENKAEEQKLESANDLRKFFLKYIDAKITKSNKLKSISGDYLSNDGKIFILATEDNKIIGKWEKKFGEFSFEYKFEGEIINNSSVLEFYEKEYNYSKSEYEFKKSKDKGYLYYSEAEENIFYLHIENTYSSKTIHKLTKNNNLKK